MKHAEKVEVLRKQGVVIPAPDAIEIGDDVTLEQIEGPDTVLHAGTKIFGDTRVLAGARIGYEAPVTLDSCAVGRRVKLNGGYHADAVYLDDCVMGLGAHVRTGTLLEEQANGAHTVGLKQTVLLPFVTLGSLINFCDVLMAGGTSRRDHSEVGSSFIHFNFTPFGKSGDKATPSLVGDVPRGVMLRERRIFLGGQAGLVGPVSIDYGTVLAAGTVYRRDHGPDELVVGERMVPFKRPFLNASYNRIGDKVTRNLRYVGNLAALYHWYQKVRLPLAAHDASLAALYRRASGLIEGGIAERIKRLGQLAGYMESSIAVLSDSDHPKAASEIETQRRFAERWDEMQAFLEGYADRGGDFAPFEQAASAMSLSDGYIQAIRALTDDQAQAGSTWLQSIVDDTITGAWPQS